MKVQVKKISPVLLEMSVAIQGGAEDFNTQVHHKLAKMQKNAKLDGFRKGKVPMQTMKMRFGQDVKAEVLRDYLLQKCFEAIDSEKLKPVNYPKIEVDKTYDEGDILSFKAQIEVIEEPKLMDFSKLKVGQYLALVSEKEVDEELEKMRDKSASFEAIKSKAQQGDEVNCDYEIFESDSTNSLSEGKQNLNVVIGSKQMIPGFEDELVGLEAGVDKKFLITFPKDYHHEPFKGKKVEFRISVKEVKRKVLPKLDDAFAQSKGEESLEGLRGRLSQSLSYQAEQMAYDKQRNDLLDELVEKHSIEVPPSLVEKEQQKLKKDYQERLEMLQKQYQAQLNANQIPTPDLETFKVQALKNVKTSIIVRHIIDTHQLKLDDAFYQKHLTEIAKVKLAGQKDSSEMAIQKEVEAIQAHYDKEVEQKRRVEAVCFEKQVVSWMIAQSQAKPKTLSLTELNEKKTAG